MANPSVPPLEVVVTNGADGKAPVRQRTFAEGHGLRITFQVGVS
jgi:hypothetical protein